MSAGAEPTDSESLPRVLGPWDALTVVIGAIIGSGIFLKPGVAARDLDNVPLILGVWIFVGFITLFGSLALAELAAMLPHAGGPYVYLREAYGRLPAFLWGWTEFWIIRTGSLGALSVATTIYLHQLVPLSRTAQEFTTIAILATLSIINILGTRWGAHVQNLTTLLKIGFLLLLIALPFALGGADPSLLAAHGPGKPLLGTLESLGLAMIAVMWPYDGWIQLAPVAEEIRNPQRNVPRALALGVGSVMILYVLTNVAYHLVLPIEEIAKSDAVAATMCEKLLGPIGRSFVAVGVVCSTFGAVNANVLSGPRIYFAMARDGLLPASIRRIHGRYKTPANAIVLQGVWAILLVLLAFAWKSRPGDAFDALTDFVIFGASIFYALAVGAVFVLRRTRPDLPRPYRTWGYPFVPAIYLVAYGAALVSLLAMRPIQSAVGGGLIAVGAMVYWMQRRRSIPIATPVSPPIVEQ